MRCLVDTSAWVAYLRQHGTPAARRVRELVRDSDVDLLGCPVVRMELALDPEELRRFRTLRWYDGLPSTDVVADDLDLAAAVYRTVRAGGHTIRSMADCLIAAAALRVGATVVHSDIDFDRIADAVTPLAALRLSPT